MTAHYDTALREPVDAETIAATARLIRPHIRRTPVIEIDGDGFGLPHLSLAMKLELMQHSGSFKVRGAFANMLLREIPASGVVAASGGSHGVAVAYAAQKLGVSATIFVPTVASPSKIQRIRGYGARLTVTGDRYADALAASEAWTAKFGGMPIHAFDQRETLLGQGTVALELEEQAPELDALLVPVGGGGLIGGIAAWYRDRVPIVGVEPEAAPTLTRALDAGRPVDAEAGGIAAESLAPRRIGELVFPIARRFVSRVILVSDDDILRAQRVLWDAARIVAEPGGVAGFAALLSRRYLPPRAARVGVVLSGSNTTAVDFDRANSSLAAREEQLEGCNTFTPIVRPSREVTIR